MAMSCIYHGECDGCMYCYDAEYRGKADFADVCMDSQIWPLLWQHSGAISESAFPIGPLSDSSVCLGKGAKRSLQ